MAQVQPVVWDTGIVDAKVAAAATRAVIAVAQQILTAGNALIMDGAKTGRIYRRRGIVHQASAPGEAPASDTGALVGSSQVLYPDQGDLLQISAFANWSTDYALGLEVGTESVEPRPYARPALDLVGPSLQPGLVAELRRELGL